MTLFSKIAGVTFGHRQASILSLARRGMLNEVMLEKVPFDYAAKGIKTGIDYAIRIAAQGRKRIHNIGWIPREALEKGYAQDIPFGSKIGASVFYRGGRSGRIGMRIGLPSEKEFIFPEVTDKISLIKRLHKGALLWGGTAAAGASIAYKLGNRDVPLEETKSTAKQILDKQQQGAAQDIFAQLRRVHDPDVSGLSEKGVGPLQRKQLTDFGSGWQGNDLEINKSSPVVAAITGSQGIAGLPNTYGNLRIAQGHLRGYMDLWHGTTGKNIPGILEKGLVPSAISAKDIVLASIFDPRGLMSDKASNVYLSAHPWVSKTHAAVQLEKGLGPTVENMKGLGYLSPKVRQAKGNGALFKVRVPMAQLKPQTVLTEQASPFMSMLSQTIMPKYTPTIDISAAKGIGRQYLIQQVPVEQGNILWKEAQQLGNVTTKSPRNIKAAIGRLGMAMIPLGLIASAGYAFIPHSTEEKSENPLIINRPELQDIPTGIVSKPMMKSHIVSQSHRSKVAPKLSDWESPWAGPTVSKEISDDMIYPSDLTNKYRQAYDISEADMAISPRPPKYVPEISLPQGLSKEGISGASRIDDSMQISSRISSGQSPDTVGGFMAEVSPNLPNINNNLSDQMIPRSPQQIASDQTVAYLEENIPLSTKVQIKGTTNKDVNIAELSQKITDNIPKSKVNISIRDNRTKLTPQKISDMINE